MSEALQILFKLFSLIPTIAAGINVVKGDVSLGEKTQAAQDALSTLTAGAAAVLPSAEGEIATALGTLGVSTIASTVAALHNTTNAPATPVVAPTPVAAA